MGVLNTKRIIQSRAYINPEQQPLPSFDFDYTYPITVYDAVKRTMDDTSPTLTEELEAVYRLISEKQNMVEAGIPGQIMTWSGMKGQIGALEVIKAISRDPVLRSNQKIPTERAIGDLMDTYTPLSAFNTHAKDVSIHITDIERTRWNGMAPKSQLDAHIMNTIVHVTNEERKRWNNKADLDIVEDHIYNTNNPHNVSAHQTGTYTREEIDDMFVALRDSFFNYMNIMWDTRTNTAELVDYHPVNWNPNYILKYSDSLPDVPNSELTYFALRPATDYTVSESDETLIYIKLPGLLWQEVGSRHMKAGDMVIRYPDTAMYAWIQGRWIHLFADSSTDDDGINGNIWLPLVDEVTGILTWTLSKEATPPTPVKIIGEDGYTPVKGIDYDDGKDGEGVPVGGSEGELLVKSSDDNFDTTWKSIIDILTDLVISDTDLPAGLIKWEYILGRPNWYDELGINTDGFPTQRVVTERFDHISNQINDILERISGDNGIESLREDFEDHINDFNNPHRLTPVMIGAVTITQFTDHITNFLNPHNVTKEQLGLSKVDNTHDMDKPISNPVQDALDDLMSKINIINNSLNGFNYIIHIGWNNTASKLTFVFKDGSEMSVIIPIIDIFNTIYFDDVTKELVIVLPDGSEHRININALLQTYFGSIGPHIKVTIGNDNIVHADIVPGSITELEIMPSVNLRGSPTTRTQPVSDRSTRIATTEFVAGQVIDNLISYEVDRPLSANMGRILNQKKVDRDEILEIIQNLEGITVIDNLDSTSAFAALSANMGRYLDLVKAPRVHTSPSGSTFGRATISLFGHAKATTNDPLMDGTVFPGTDDGAYARGDHRHPTDITRAPIHFPDVVNNQYGFTGEPRTTTPPANSNDDRIPTTSWVKNYVTGGTGGSGEPSILYMGDCYTLSTDPNKIITLKSSSITGKSKAAIAPEEIIFNKEIGVTVSVTFTSRDRSNPAVTTLNIQNSGASRVLFGGKPLNDEMIGRDHTHMFVYDGNDYWIINPVPGTYVEPGKDEKPDDPGTPVWIPVTHITGLPTEIPATDTQVVLNGIAMPLNATSRNIVYSIVDAGIAEATLNTSTRTITIDRSKVTPTTNANVKIKIYIDKGINATTPFEYIHTINIVPPVAPPVYVPVTHITGMPTEVAANQSSISLSGLAMPLNANSRDIVYSIVGTNDIDAIITGNNTLSINRDKVTSDMNVYITIKMYIDKGLSITTPYETTHQIYIVPPDDPVTDTVITSNTLSGFNGYTVMPATSIGTHGETDIALIMYTFDNKNVDVNITLSPEEGSFALKMGDGKLISVTNPVILNKTRENCNIQFTMNSVYPSHSPCQLVYSSKDAWIKVEEI